MPMIQDPATGQMVNVPQTGLIGSEQALRQGLAGSTQAMQDAQQQAFGSLQAGLGGSNAALEQARQRANQNIMTAGGQVANSLGRTRGLAGNAFGAAESGINSAYNQATGYLDPFAQAGQQAINPGLALAGANGQEAFDQAFIESPVQKFLREQGSRAVTRQSAALGGLGGGNVMKELTRFGQGLAGTQLQQQIENLRAQQQMGQQAAGQQGQFRGQQASALGNLGAQKAGMLADLGAREAAMLENAGARIADINTQYGTQRANNYNNLGSQMAGITTSFGSQLGQNMYNTGQALSGGRTRAGEQLSALANLGGQQQAQTISDAGGNLANILSGTGTQQATNQTNLAQLLANLASQSSGQSAGLPGIPGIQEYGGIADTLAGMSEGAGTAMAGFSDIRLKENIEPVGVSAGGNNLYTWDWNEDGKRIAGDQPTFGVLAQEMQEKDPDSVITGDHGFLMVDYSRVN